MADGNGNGNGKKGLLGLGLGHLLTGGSAVGAGVAGSVYVMQYKIDEAQKQLTQIPLIQMQLVRITETQEEATRQLTDIKARLDKYEQTDRQLIQTTDKAAANAQRLDNIDREVQYLMNRQPVVPSDPHAPVLP